ncbi:lysophospholipid acyltransferase family protein [Methylovirgula sp. 4M-Z18]|uniref:lysophospholipid acyltransferase family protein n=1 Tax=Methylovirgula sp. 4M-Z18 TaxID=2293567 RepID=UPI000E2FCD9C|nr:lysophospholipid acyltransferase family protein [Methylovirgula sp. 4M-Z18]RFB81209.1 1-acyl-sn-glycerol-3-phosphate acyltransferase [Methylovirgula sp. 4M-Z18]
MGKQILARVLGFGIIALARLVTGVRPDWRGCLPSEKQRLYFANHASHGDFLLIWTALPWSLRGSTRPVAAQDYWGGNDLMGFIGRSVFNAVLIDRQHQPGQPAPLDVMMAAVNERVSLIFFPEGTRNTSDEPLLPFKSGLYHLSKANPELELVPVWIENIGRVMPKGEFLPVPLLCSVIFGAPIAVAPDEERDDFIARARNALLALKPADFHR